MEYRHLIQDPIIIFWNPAMLTEIDCLVNTKTTRFIKRRNIPRGERAVYTRLVVDLQPNKVIHERLILCMGDIQMTSVMDTTT